MCDTGSIMQNQMDDQIQAGINERDACYARIDELEKALNQVEILLGKMTETGNKLSDNYTIYVQIVSIIQQAKSKK